MSICYPNPSICTSASPGNLPFLLTQNIKAHMSSADIKRCITNTKLSWRTLLTNFQSKMLSDGLFIEQSCTSSQPTHHIANTNRLPSLIRCLPHNYIPATYFPGITTTLNQSGHAYYLKLGGDCSNKCNLYKGYNRTELPMKYFPWWLNYVIPAYILSFSAVPDIPYCVDCPKHITLIIDSCLWTATAWLHFHSLPLQKKCVLG